MSVTGHGSLVMGQDEATKNQELMTNDRERSDRNDSEPKASVMTNDANEVSAPIPSV